MSTHDEVNRLHKRHHAIHTELERMRSRGIDHDRRYAALQRELGAVENRLADLTR